MVSADGGTEPRWSPTGKEILYRSLDHRRVFAVGVQTGPNLRLGSPRAIVATPQALLSNGFWSDYDVSRDGLEILMHRLDRLPDPPQLHVVVGALR